MVISIVNEKGGCGKTTLAVNLAATLSHNGDNVLLLDADPQNSTGVFSERRNDVKLPILFSNMSKTGSSLGGEIDRIKNAFDSIVIDTGGRDNIEMEQAMLKSNITIIPVVPSQYDTAVFEHMLKVFEKAKIYNPDLLIFVVLARVSPNPFLAKESDDLREFIVNLIEQKGIEKIFVMKNIIYERQNYRKSVIDGKSLQEFCQKDDKALTDFKALFDELVKIANNNI